MKLNGDDHRLHLRDLQFDHQFPNQGVALERFSLAEVGAASGVTKHVPCEPFSMAKEVMMNRICAFFLLTILLVSCAPTEQVVQTKTAETQVANTETPIQTITSTATPVLPGSRAHALHEQGYSAVEIAQALIEEFGTTQDELLEILAAEGFSVHDVYLVLDSLADAPPPPVTFVRLLHEQGYPPVEIVQVLIEEYVSVEDELIWILEDGGFSAHDVYLVLDSFSDTPYPPLALVRDLLGYYPPVEIAQVLIDEYGTTKDELLGLLVEGGFSARDYYHVLVDLFSYSAADARQALRTQGYTASQVVDFLVEEFGLDAQEVAQVLKDDGYGADEIAVALRDSLALDALATAQILKDNGSSVMEVGAALRDDFALDALLATQILKAIGYNSSDTYQALMQVFGLSVEKVRQNLADAGFSADEIFEVVTRELAVKYAPQLRFDSGSGTCSQSDTYPMSAQWYFTSKSQNPGAFLSNEVASTITNNTIPIYWKAFQCGRQIRLVYWILYGYQFSCDCGFTGPFESSWHDADWEHIVVILSEDTNSIGAVTYFQHGGWYTRLAARGGFEVVEGSHPVVYVGRTSHGNYHDTQTAFQTCCYWEDHRDGNGPTMNSWLGPLLRMQPVAEGGEPWMDEDLAAEFTWGEISQHPMANNSGNCGMLACEGTSTWGCQTSGCFRSQCEVGDRDDYLGTCWHCPTGYTDNGAFCGKGTWFWEWKTTSIHTYGYDYHIPQCDAGLFYKLP